MARGKPLSPDIRELIGKYIQEGKSRYFIAKTLKLPYSTVKSAAKNYLTRGSTKCLKKTGRSPSVSVRELRVLRRIIKKNRRATASEITANWNSEVKRQISVSTCSRHMKKMGYSFYKVNSFDIFLYAVWLDLLNKF